MKRLAWLGIALWLFLAGCTFSVQRKAAAGATFVPPVGGEGAAVRLTPTPTPLPVLPEVAARPTAVADCTNSLRFVADETIPDNTVVQPGEALDKRWRVKNAGTCNWDGRYRLRHVAGWAMGAPEEMALFPARAGAEVVVRIVFTAPDAPGNFFSTWQAVDPLGRPFGDPIYIQITVARPKPTATP